MVFVCHRPPLESKGEVGGFAIDLLMEICEGKVPMRRGMELVLRSFHQDSDWQKSMLWDSLRMTRCKNKMNFPAIFFKTCGGFAWS